MIEIVVWWLVVMYVVQFCAVLEWVQYCRAKGLNGRFRGQCVFAVAAYSSPESVGVRLGTFLCVLLAARARGIRILSNVC
jgi:hypothetical protein